MKTNIVSIIILILCFFSCTNIFDSPWNDSAPQSTPFAGIQEPQPPAVPDLGFCIPALTAHIIYREFVNLNPHITSIADFNVHYPPYYESRLMELYPGKVTPGMVAEQIENVKQFEKDYESYLVKLDYWEKSLPYYSLEFAGDTTTVYEWPENHVDEMPHYQTHLLTIEQLSDSMNMTEEEIAYWWEIEDMVKESLSGGLAKRRDYNTYLQSMEPDIWLEAAVVSLGLGGYIAWRILQSEDRANNRTNHYFGDDWKGNTRADAFRHTFVSVHLRRYIGRPLAYLVMWAHEYLNPNANPGSTFMDHHNNYLGRVRKYSHFRAHWFWDRYRWKKWSRRVKNYVMNENKEEYIFEWDENANPDWVIQQRQKPRTESMKYLIGVSFSLIPILTAILLYPEPEQT